MLLYSSNLLFEDCQLLNLEANAAMSGLHIIGLPTLAIITLVAILSQPPRLARQWVFPLMCSARWWSIPHWMLRWFRLECEFVHKRLRSQRIVQLGPKFFYLDPSVKAHRAALRDPSNGKPNSYYKGYPPLNAARTLFTTMDTQQHKETKRRVLSAFKKDRTDSMRNLETCAKQALDKTLRSACRNAAKTGNRLDLAELAHRSFLEIWFSVIHGQRESDISAAAWKDLKGFLSSVESRQCCPDSLIWLSGMIDQLSSFITGMVKANDTGKSSRQVIEQFITESNITTLPDKNVYPNPSAYLRIESSWTTDQLTAELIDLSEGGENITILILTIFWLLSLPKHYSTLEKLRLASGPERSTLIRGVVRETLRLYPPFAGPQERTLAQKTDIDGNGFLLPQGCVIAFQAYTANRNPEVFPEPDRWCPDRWLDEDDHKRREMVRESLSFGLAQYDCPGADMALQVASLATESWMAEYVNLGNCSQ